MKLIRIQEHCRTYFRANRCEQVSERASTTLKLFYFRFGLKLVDFGWAKCEKAVREHNTSVNNLLMRENVRIRHFVYMHICACV